MGGGGGLLVKERDQVTGEGKGTLSSYSITSQGQRAVQKASMGSWARDGSYTIEFIFNQKLGAKSHDGEIGFLGPKTTKKSRYQHKSSPQVKAVILPVASSPSGPHQKAFERSWLSSLRSCSCPVGGPLPKGGRGSPRPSPRASFRSREESSDSGMLRASWRKRHTF